MKENCTLELSNGVIMTGFSIGDQSASSGEMVFTTGMVGYSEALTDPSYAGQILTFTFPLIGNYGIPKLPQHLEVFHSKGFESNRVHARGVVCALNSRAAFHWSSVLTLDAWLKDQKVPGIVGIDVRHLTHLIRDHSPLFGKIQPEGIQAKKDYFDPSAVNILDEVSTKKIEFIKSPIKNNGKNKTVALVDCGVKWNILRQILATGCDVKLLPWNADLKQVECDGWLFGNGPGDPKRAEILISQVEALLSKSKPILGICLGHQILALAAGAKTSRMKFGHRSHNQPVYEVDTGRGAITSQNHGYVVEENSLPNDFSVWFRNANDETCEGIKHKTKNIRSVQFHPEAAGGPRETGWILEEFIACL